MSRHLVRAGLLLFAAGISFSIALAQIGYGLALLVWLALVATGRMPRPRRTGLDLFVLGYIAAELLSFAFSTDHGMNFVYLRRLLLVPLFYLAAECLHSRRELRHLLETMIGVAALLSLYGIARYLAGPGGLDSRVALFKSYMTTGGILMIVALWGLGLSLPWRPRAVGRWVIAATLVCCLCLLFTFTRSSWLGFLAGCIVIAICAERRIVWLLAVAAVAGHFLSHGALAARFASIFDPSHPNNIERTYMWRSALRIIRDHPWTGIGDIDASAIYARYKLPEAQQMHGHFHSNLLQIGVTLGVPGILAVSAFFVGAFVLLWRNVRRSPRSSWERRVAVAALAAFVAFQVNGLFEWNFGDAEIAMLLWLTLGLSEAAARLRAAAEPECRAARAGRVVRHPSG